MINYITRKESLSRKWIICTSENVGYVERLSSPTGFAGEKRARAECRVRKGYLEGRCRLWLGRERVKCGLEAE
jgi:hypothetical protein